MAENTRMNRYQREKPKTKKNMKSVPAKKKSVSKKKPKSNKKITKKKVSSTKITKPIQKKKVKIRYRRVLVALVLILIISFSVFVVCNAPITNLYVYGNTYYKDQTILELAEIDHYPANVTVIPSLIEKNLEKEELIKEAKVKKRGRSISITIIENTPLFYYSSRAKTVLLDGTESQNQYPSPILINYIPDTQYEDFLMAMKNVEREVLERISEIKYDPDEVDDGRFLLSMRDGNYVYLTLSKFNAINSYINIIREFPGQKGILYLNAGNSFEVLEK